MKRALGQMETDERGRMIIRMGDACPTCGAEPDWKISACGRVVLYHRPAACSTHARPRQDETLAVAERQRML